MTVYERLAENFYRWENRGRGGLTYEWPVELEPPFIPFPGHRLRLEGPVDDGTRPTFLSKLTDKMFRALQPPKTSALSEPEPEEPEPNWCGEEDELPVEFRVMLPSGATHSAELMANFLKTLATVNAPVAFEVIGTGVEVSVQITARVTDAAMLEQQLAAQFPDARLSWSQEILSEAWKDDGSSERVVIDFGLCREFMMPLDAGTRLDPFVSLVGAMAHLREGEAAVYQVIFAPLSAPWRENVMAAVTKGDGKPFFDDGADLVKGATEKMGRPLYGVVLRLAAKSEQIDRTWEIVRGLSPALRLFSRHGGQSLMPLTNVDYDHEAHCDDLVRRRSRRCGMILNLDELVGLVHWPTAGVKSEKLARLVEDNSRAAPLAKDAQSEIGTITLGVNEHAGDESLVTLTTAQRLQHMHVVGGTGTGKSTFLLSLMLQDLESGQGFALVDPHGDLIDKVLASVPPSRLDDVILIDPSDEDHVTPFNVLSAHSDHEKTLLASDLVSVFRRLSTSWGDRMGIIFQNLVLAFLEHTEGGTLADMRRFLVDADWRGLFLQGVDDPDVRFYWEQTFPKLDGPKSVGPILTRLETLLTPKIIRYMVSQQENRIDFSKIMDEGRILLVRLPQGLIGTENAFMLGSLVMVKLQQMAMGRARMPAKDRVPFFCYVDECQYFVTPSMAAILSGARKYGLGLVLAHQDLHQLSQSADVASAVMTNAATRVVFRVSDADGRALKGDFAHYEPKDFSSLKQGHALCRIERADQDFNLRVILPEAPDEDEAEDRRIEAIEASRRRYTVPRKDVEAELRRKMAEQSEATKPSRQDKKLERKPPATTAEQVAPAPPDAPPVDASPMVAQDAPPPVILLPPPREEIQPARSAGMGRGGDDHQMIVARLTAEGGGLGYKATKEATVAGGRADLTLESRNRRIAVEVAVNTNTAHEIENLTKCVDAGFDFIVSVAPLANVRENIERAARKEYSEAILSKLRFLSPDELLTWLSELAAADRASTAPSDQPRIIAGRRVRVRHMEVSPEERRRIEAEQLEEIADLVNKNRSKLPED